MKVVGTYGMRRYRVCVASGYTILAMNLIEVNPILDLWVINGTLHAACSVMRYVLGETLLLY